MSDYDVDVDMDDMDDLTDVDADVPDAGTDTPDPLDTPDVDDVSGSTVEFEDGTTVDSPHQDALGYVYKTTDDWIAGANKNVVE